MIKKIWAMPFVAVAVMCVALLTGCGSLGQSPEDAIRADVEAGMKQISVDNKDFMDAFDKSAGSSFADLGIDSKEFMSAYLDGFKYDITNVTVNDKTNTATAEVTVSMKSLSSIMLNFQNHFTAYTTNLGLNLDATNPPSEDEMMKEAGTYLMQAIKETGTSESTITFTYQKGSDGTWELQGDYDTQLLEAMKQGVITNALGYKPPRMQCVRGGFLCVCWADASGYCPG